MRHLLVIGAQRCGTTYLYRLLDEHPDVAMARPMRPEPKFFLDSDQFGRGYDWYRKTYFDGRDDVAVLGEKTTSYIESPVAAERAASMLDDVDIVAMVRDPVARAVSNWRFSTATELEDRSLSQALRENLAGPRAWDPALTSVSPFAYLERGRYSEHLAAWIEHFGDRVHVFFVEEMAGHPDGVAAAFRTLRLDSDVRVRAVHEVVNAAQAPAQQVDAELEADLRAYFADSDRQLRSLLGRPLPWPGHE